MSDGKDMDKSKDIEILLEKCDLLRLSKGVMQMAENSPEVLNTVYKEISEKLGMDTAMEIYRMFKGQQISFPKIQKVKEGNYLKWWLPSFHIHRFPVFGL